MELGNPLLTDLYELTMMQGYFKNSSKNKTVVFDLFYRENPWGNGYSVMCGSEQVLDYIDRLKFDNSDIEYLSKLNLFEKDFLEYLRNFRFTGDIYSIDEGSIIFPKEPILKIIAPIMEAQLIETAVLCIINHQSLIATKAARIREAVGTDNVMEFGLRRAQGPDAGIYGARAAIIGGCSGTSNLLSGKMFDIPVMGTHAHSWVMSFNTELEAFRTYSRLFPNIAILLVDTYDTLNSGIPNAIKVFNEMKENGMLNGIYGIRLDSGDLAYISKKARIMLDEAGFNDAIICASNDLDEILIDSLKNQGAKISLWGVGTKLITAEGNSSFGGVYKMAAIEGDSGEFVPKIKLSDNAEKVTNPGNKKVYRIYEEPEHKIKADYICLDHEVLNPDGELHLFSPTEPWKKTVLEPGSYSIKEILKPVYIKGKRTQPKSSVMQLQKFCNEEKETLWAEARRLVNPHRVAVDLSRELYNLKNKLFNKNAGNRTVKR